VDRAPDLRVLRDVENNTEKGGPVSALLAIRRAVIPISMLAITACAAARESSQRGVGNDARIPVEITNDNWLAIAVYAMEAGVPFRIGTVDSFRTEVLRLPWSTRPAEARLLIRPIGSTSEYLSPPLSWTGEGRLQFTVAESLPLSHQKDAAVKTSERNWDADRTR
jgi:hypothetical protein